MLRIERRGARALLAGVSAIYWDMPCPKLKASVFAAFGAPRTLLRNVQVSELNAGLQLYLTPAGTGCVSMKKELFH